jgi:transcriptional regulator with XRE-family HTH domain
MKRSVLRCPDRLRTWRLREIEISARKMSAALGWGPHQIWAIENGKNNFSKVKAEHIEQHYGLTADFFKIDDSMPVDCIYPMRGQALLGAAAQRIAKGERQYGAPIQLFTEVAALWSVLLRTQVTAQDVTRCMMALKMVRARDTDDAAVLEDSLLDIAGYSACEWDMYRDA